MDLPLELFSKFIPALGVYSKFVFVYLMILLGSNHHGFIMSLLLFFLSFQLVLFHLLQVEFLRFHDLAFGYLLGLQRAFLQLIQAYIHLLVVLISFNLVAPFFIGKLLVVTIYADRVMFNLGLLMVDSRGRLSVLAQRGIPRVAQSGL